MKVMAIKQQKIINYHKNCFKLNIKAKPLPSNFLNVVYMSTPSGTAVQLFKLDFYTPNY